MARQTARSPTKRQRWLSRLKPTRCKTTLTILLLLVNCVIAAYLLLDSNRSLYTSGQGVSKRQLHAAQASLAVLPIPDTFVPSRVVRPLVPIDLSLATANCAVRYGAWPRDWNANPVRIHSNGVLQPSKTFDDGQVAGRYNHETKELGRCPVPCRSLRGDPALSQHAADLFIVRTPRELAFRDELRCPHQLFGLASMESEAYHTQYSLNKTLPYFGFVATTRRSSDVPLVYASWREYDFYKEPLPFKKRKRKAVAVAFISNCDKDKSDRLAFIRDLQVAGLTVDFYGRCGDSKRRVVGPNMQQLKRKIMRQYKFALAFENSVVNDYVTEKFFQALEVGTVPVTRGPRNIADFAPDEKYSYIDSFNFDSPADLAKHLMDLASDEEEYKKHLEWKVKGVSKKFSAWLENTTDVDSFCRACMYVKDTMEKRGVSVA